MGTAAWRPTVKDVAAAAGVSASTVSNVLHDHPHVTADKRVRVEAAIRRIGYRLSYAGRPLRGRTGRVLALAIPDIRSPYFSGLAHVVTTEAGRREMALFVDETEGRLDQERPMTGVVVGLVFPTLLATGAPIVFLALTVMGLVAFGWVAFMVPETKDHSLEDLEARLMRPRVAEPGGTAA